MISGLKETHIMQEQVKLSKTSPGGVKEERLSTSRQGIRDQACQFSESFELTQN